MEYFHHLHTWNTSILLNICTSIVEKLQPKSSCSCRLHHLQSTDAVGVAGYMCRKEKDWQVCAYISPCVPQTRCTNNSYRTTATEQQLQNNSYRTTATEQQLQNSSYRTAATEQQLQNSSYRTTATEQQLQNSSYRTTATEQQLQNNSYRTTATRQQLQDSS